jgi:hypothetical protein
MTQVNDSLGGMGFSADSAVTRGYVIEPSGIGTAAVSDDTAALIIGVALSDAAAGEVIDLGSLPGTYTVVAGGEIDALANIAPNTDGTVVASDTNYRICGQALEAAAESGDQIRAYLYNGWIQAA